MGYVIAIILVVLAVAGFVTFLVLNATRRSGAAADADRDGTPGIGRDETPFGDTTEHAGPQSPGGRTSGPADAAGPGGTGRPVQAGAAGTSPAGEDPDDPDRAAHRARPGEAEAAAALDFQGRRPRERR